MLKKVLTVILLAVFLSTPFSGLRPHAALAEDVNTSTPPVVTIHSTGGTINITSGNDLGVHVLPGLAAQTVHVSRFDPAQIGATRIILPERFVRQRWGRGWRTVRLPPRQFSVPVAKFGSEGVNVENPGGDMSIAVPKKVGAIFINAESGNVVLRKLRGPYVISAADGQVRMINVVGAGLIRTASGNVTLGGVGGNVRVQTVSGAVTVFGSFADSVDVQSENGPIYWRFVHCGNGLYSFRSKGGSIRLGFRAAAAAQLDAQSDTGTVQNLFPSSAASGSAVVRVASQHALSVAINGGGPEITATTTSGDISIESIPEPSPTSPPNSGATP
jgi:Putative adhesin